MLDARDARIQAGASGVAEGEGALAEVDGEVVATLATEAPASPFVGSLHIPAGLAGDFGGGASWQPVIEPTPTPNVASADSTSHAGNGAHERERRNLAAFDSITAEA